MSSPAARAAEDGDGDGDGVPGVCPDVFGACSDLWQLAVAINSRVNAMQCIKRVMVLLPSNLSRLRAMR